MWRVVRAWRLLVLDDRLCGKVRSENLLKSIAEAEITGFRVNIARSLSRATIHFLTKKIQSHTAAVQKQTRHNLYRLAQRVRRVARPFHECQELNDPFLFVRTFEVELIGEPPAGRRNIGEAEFPPLIEFSLNP
jgi:hypothetical protein